jgi:hypothetical protein
MTEATGLRGRITASVDVENTVALALVTGDFEPGGYTATTKDGVGLAAQVTRRNDGGSVVAVMVPRLGASETLEVTLDATGSESSGRGIELDDQPENGRIVVNYSGFLQTIYHYGAENFKPRFYPLTAPCARMGAIDGDNTVYPKSVTDDSPPDHIWHRSLWYACGDVNGTDFYLENGGEGRIVHREFTELFSGPLAGGFEERLEWVTPEGKALVADRRSFMMYRLKGPLRVFDIEAEFTAVDGPVTFGQTNENALPLLRVADVIDEWDGGRLTLSTGLTGGKACFAQRAEWADCSGPLVHLPGRGPEWYGIAMLDHPSNRNHPNAWFARSYGPLGTNLPFFDGPLTLETGETWSLRHRIVIHAGNADEAGIAARFAEYANPPELAIE